MILNNSFSNTFHIDTIQYSTPYGCSAYILIQLFCQKIIVKKLPVKKPHERTEINTP